jgi:PAS domain S-box-containing protein
MNSLLQRQIKKYLHDFSGPDDPRLHDFLVAVSRSYDGFENDQQLMQRSLEISSEEMLAKNKILEQQAQATKEAIDAIIRSVAELAPETYTQSIYHENSVEEITRLSDFLTNVIIEHKRSVMEMVKQKFKTEQLMVEIEKFQLAVDNAVDYIVFCDNAFNVTYINKSGMQNPSLSQTLGRNITSLDLTKESSLEVLNVIQRIRQGEDTLSFELSTNHNDLIPAATYQVGTTIVRVDGNPQFIINIARDITKEKMLDRQKDEFVSVASHELRTPMTAIRGFATVLLNGRFGELNEKQADLVQKIGRNSTNLIELVGDMLDLNKLSAGKLTIAIDSYKLISLVSSEIDKFQAMYEEKGLRLETDLQYEGDVCVDQIHFARVLTNLLSNALKFTKEGSVTVRTERDGDMVKVSVIDTGIGIPATSLSQLFKKFSQVDNVLQRQVSGTGLGLAICKDLVESMGGKIGVVSEYKKGSTFSFTIPTKKAEVKEEG